MAHVHYIDDIALAIYKKVEGGPSPTLETLRLYRIYAVLCLVLGQTVTFQDVHDAWSAWQAQIDGNHRSLIPFDELSEEVQLLDKPYADAIAEVAKERGF